MKKGLIVFAREPIPGTVKTRLAVVTGAQAAADLYEVMLSETLNTCRQLGDITTCIYWDCSEDSLPDLVKKYRFKSCRQSPGDLGRRMQNAFEEMFENGCDICCIIGSDAPDLPLLYIEDAYRMLAMEQTDVVFGPCRDGGYYLLGIKKIAPPLFNEIPWGSDAVLERSMAAARISDLTVSLLPEWQDIDTFEDLEAYRKRALTVNL